MCECVHVGERKKSKRWRDIEREREHVREKAREIVLSNEHCAPRTITLSIL